MSVRLLDLAQIDKKAMDVARTGMSDPSEPGSVVVASGSIVPSAPTASLAAASDQVVLTLTAPTTKVSGDALHNFSQFGIYHSTSAAVDIAVADVFFSSATHVPFPCLVKTYFKVTAVDTFGNESAPSAEISETPDASSPPTADIPDDATGYVFDDDISFDGIVVGDGIIGIAFKTPGAAWVNFDRYSLWWQYTDDGGSNWYDEDDVVDQWTEIDNVKRYGHVHKGLNTSYAYRYCAHIVATDGTISTIPDLEDNGGVGFTPDAADNGDIVGETIFTENLVCLNEIRAEHIKASTITADKLSFSAFVIGTNDLDDVGDGSTYSRVLKTDISAGHILLSETTGDLDDIADGSTYGKVATTDISAGHILLVSSQAALNINNASFGYDGIQLQYNGGNPRAYIGDGSSKYFKFDGVNISWKGVNAELTAAGVLTCSNINVTGGTWGGDTLATAKIPNLDCDKITSGTFGTVRIPSLSCSKITSGTFDAVRIPSLDCDKITSGTFGTVRIPNLSCSKITSGTFDAVRIPNLATSKITSGTFDPVRIPNLSFSTIIAGTNTASLTIGSAGYLQSSNYSAGSAGFKITGAGNAEFNAVTVRGTINATGGTWAGNDISYGHIAANAVRTSELYIDGDVNFASTGPTYNRIYGTGIVFFGAGGLSANNFVGLAGDGVSIKGNDHLYLGFGGDQVQLTAATTTTGNCNYAGGSIVLTISGVTRRIKLWQV